MNHQTSEANGDDAILAQIMLELDQAGKGVAEVEVYVRRYPHMAEQIRELFAARDALDILGPEPKAAVPERLGEFCIVRRLARGGMGEVFEAIQEPLKRRVAVKTIRKGQLSAGNEARFLREQHVLALLHQTHIVPIHTAGREGALQYFAMPYIDGAALDHVVQTALRLGSTQPGSKTPSLAKLAGMQPHENKPAAKVPPPVAPRAHSPEAKTEAITPPASPESPGEPNGGSPTSSLTATKRVVLSQEYFRSVAKVMAETAEAISHAHRVHILHRDIKPSNIMVDKDEQCWIIDFGLAGYLNGQKSADTAKEPLDLGPDPATCSGVLGTPQYMAPEQFDGKADARTDVWGLGVTLYELLTLRRAFNGSSFDEVKRRIRSEQPRSPQEDVGGVPLDLAAICGKAMQKHSGKRYQTAQEFGQDLKRWLHDEPTRARPPSVFRRVRLWSRRNKGWAAAIGSIMLAFVTLAVGGFFLEASKAAEAVAKAAEAEAMADAANAKTRAAEEVAEAQRCELLLHQLTQARLTTHRDGWFEEVTTRARQIAAIRRGEKHEQLRDQFAAALAGLDAKPLPGLKIDASSVVFSKDGQRLLIGGYTDFQGEAREPARVWLGGIDEPRKSMQLGSGPVIFRDLDGAALQFAPDPKDWFKLRLWNVDKQELVREFRLVDQPSPPDWFQRNSLTLAVSGDGSLVAASTVSLVGDQGMLLIWDVQSGKTLRTVEKGFSALAFTPDGALLAAGDREGTATLWSRKQEKELAVLPVGRTEITCLAFRRDSHQRPGTAPEDGWLLAAGEAGSTITIWDLQNKQLRTICRGSAHAVHGVAFSPDGSLLASAGRLETKLWDAATGQLLLNVVGYPGRNWLTGLTFSPDGSKLAVSSCTAFAQFGYVDVWQVEYGRGIQTLHGLTNRVAQISMSPDDRLLAALADDWKVGIWDLSSGRLLQVLEVPRGYYTDNAHFAFSPNGSLLAFSTGTSARLWDVKSGKEVAQWLLPPGICDRIAFDPSGKRLLLVRVETEKRKLPPLSNVPWREHPQVLRGYDLLGPAPTKPFVEINEFKRGVWVCAIAPDAAYFVVAGMPDGVDLLRRTIKVLDGATGTKELLSFHGKDVSRIHRSIGHTDPTGKHLALEVPPFGRLTLFEMPTGKMIRRSVERLPNPAANLWVNGTSIYRDDERLPLVTLDHDEMKTSGPKFSVKGTQMAWGNHNGTVTLCDLEEINRRLSAVGLGW